MCDTHSASRHLGSRLLPAMKRLLNSPWLLAALLLALAYAGLTRYDPVHNGDIAEYTLTTVAFANHGTPEIRPDDLRHCLQALPAMAGAYASLSHDLTEHKTALTMPFVYGRGGGIYAIHFFAYSALAAPAYRLLPQFGLPAFKCYQAVNLAMVVLLGLSLRRLFRDNLKALLGVALFLACGSWPYLRWSSPEVMSAAALLSALVLFCTGAPLRAGLLAALGALQNPSIVFALLLAPLLRYTVLDADGLPPRQRALAALQGRRGLAGLGLGAALALAAPLWNLWQFGVPSVIAAVFTRAEFASLTRLHSLFFDLSQGMLIAVPALLLLLAGWALVRPGDGARAPWLLPACALLMLAMALPALPVINWNSGAQGMMRYAVWASAPLLFAALWQMRTRRGWLPPLLLVLLCQARVSYALERYVYLDFSPLAGWVLQHAPQLYNPEPEIFAERSKHRDDYFDEPEIYTFSYRGQATKTLYHAATQARLRKLCGPQAELAPDNHYADSTRGWRYINGSVRCRPVSRQP